MPSATRLIDVSHTIEYGMITYKGFPAPIVCDRLSREASRARYDDAEFQIGHLTERAAAWLANAGAALVGIDSTNIDSIATGKRPVHSILLAREIPIVEHMCGLAAAPERGGRFSAVPVKVKGMGTFPVRAFILDGGR